MVLIMKNKELVDKLTKYFREQDQETICRLTANLMLDCHRFLTLDSLEEDEIRCLHERLLHNSKELITFAKNGPKGNLRTENVW